MMRGRIRGAIIGLMGIVAVLVATFASAHAVGAAPAGDPYGPTSTTPPSSFEAACDLSVTSGAPGTRVTATVSNVPPSGTVRILFDGEEVARDTAPAAPAAIRSGIGGQATATLEIDFVVPDLGVGTYVVSAVGANFTLECSPEANGFGVLASSSGGVTGSSGGGGSLAFTGLNILLLVIVAIALIVGGRYFVKAARERREARIY